MKERFFILEPERVKYEEFQDSIKKRNRWLIMLRYGASAMLFVFYLILIVLKEYFDISGYNSLFPLLLISISILLYNLIFHKYHNLDEEKRKKIKLYGLRFSLLQIIFDFITLMLFVYFTGGVETPIYCLFIFHIIIGSLFLPGRIMFIIITTTLILTFTGAYLEFTGAIPHYHIFSWYDYEYYRNPIYLVVFFSTFALLLYVSSYLTNSISRELYDREGDLSRALKQLEEAEKTKSRYVMTVVHDLKTPIAAATTYLNMILEGSLGEVRKEFKRPLERSKYRLDLAIEAINDILQISKLKVESKPEDIEAIKIKALVDEVYYGMKVLFINKNQEVNILGDEDVEVQFNKKLLKLVLGNILSNSMKYTNKGGRIDIDIKRTGIYAELKIADSGIGIPEKVQDKIFHEFYRTPISKKKGIEGSGLGLTLVKQILDKFNSKIEIKSPSELALNTDNPGTEITISIPLFYIVP